MKIHVWAPGVYEQPGGIEAYSGAVVTGIADLDQNHHLTVLAKHDPPTKLRGNLPSGVRGSGTGDVPLRFRTAAFAAMLAARGVVGRADLILTTHLNFSPVAAWLKERFGIPYWVALHGIEAWDLEDPARVAALKAADLLLPVSGFTLDRVAREQGIPPDRFRILPDTFDPDAWKLGPKPEYLLERYGLAPDQPVILTVGRLSASERYKGQDRVLRVLRDVAEQVGSRKAKGENDEAGVRYLIVGDGDDRARLERIAKDEGVSDIVTFAGRVPQEELADHYRLCDVFAMPSTGEGFGIVFLEAMACGKPVIGGTRDAAVDALRNGELGVLVDPEEAAQLRDTLVAVLREVESRKSKVEGAERRDQRVRSQASDAGLQTAGTIPLPEIIFQPEALRTKVIEHFGFERFRETLREILTEKFPESRKSKG